jgi:hypothetical protein
MVFITIALSLLFLEIIEPDGFITIALSLLFLNDHGPVRI